MLRLVRDKVSVRNFCFFVVSNLQHHTETSQEIMPGRHTYYPVFEKCMVVLLILRLPAPQTLTSTVNLVVVAHISVFCN